MLERNRNGNYITLLSGDKSPAFVTRKQNKSGVNSRIFFSTGFVTPQCYGGT